MDADDIARASSVTPMREYDDLAAGAHGQPPAAPGFYAWWQTPGALPGVPGTPHPTEPLELLYVGIGPSSATSKRDLRQRLANHHRSAIGSSTFRFSLTAFLWEANGWSVGQPTDRPVLAPADLIALADWQRRNLRVQWVEVPEPWLLESQVIELMRPPLNREHNEGHRAYPIVGAARDRLRRAAAA